MAAYLDETGHTIDQRMSVKGAGSSICNPNAYLEVQVTATFAGGRRYTSDKGDKAYEKIMRYRFLDYVYCRNERMK